MMLETYLQLLGKHSVSECSVEDLLVYVLVRVYMRVDWKKTARGRDPLDVFQHRVLAAAYAATFRQFLERLCRSLGLQSVRVEAEVLYMLDKHNKEVLELARTSSIYLVAKAYDTYKRIIEQRKKQCTQQKSD